MLTHLLIQDVVLIERLELDLASGLSTFTGETGAGKSIILDSLGLATGARADPGLIRSGQNQALVMAEFSVISSEILGFLAEKGIDIDPNEAVRLKRTLSRDGRSKAFVNEQIVGVATLKALGDKLLEVHGQHDTTGLLDPRTHLGLLDDFAHIPEELSGMHNAYRAARSALIAYQDALKQVEADRSDQELLQARLEALDRLNPDENEDEVLSQKRALLGASERALEDIGEARGFVGGEQLTQRLMKAFRALDHARSRAKAAGATEDDTIFMRLSEAAEALDRTIANAEDAIALMDQAAYALDIEPGALDKVEERLFELRAEARKLGVSVDQLPRMRHDIAQRLALIADQSDHLLSLDKAASLAQKQFEAKVLIVRQKRQKAAISLTMAVMKELPALKLEKASFRVAFEEFLPNGFGANGGDGVTFEIKTNPGADWGALNAIASGGELARLALALKASLSLRSDGASSPVMIFDEVDQGVGGAVADAVGMRLKSLSERAQVLVVTHSPQIAALGHHHLKVMKNETSEGTRTSVCVLDEVSSLEEIARMLSGASITEEARAAALRLKKNSKGGLFVK